jgi:hypothetical protein
MSVVRPVLRARAVQIVAQNDGGGEVVECRSPLAPGALCAATARRCRRFLGPEDLFRLPGTEPLIHHFDWNTQGLFDARGKALRFLGHFAGGAVQVQRQSDNDAVHSVLPNQFAQAGEIAPAIGACPGRKRPLRHAALVREREAQPLLSVIDCEDYTRGCGVQNKWRRAEGAGHTPL